MAYSNIIFALFWVAQLSCHAVLTVADECQQDVCCPTDLCVPSPAPECCNGPSVSEDTVDVRFMVEVTGNSSQPWNVKALVQWEPPTDNDIFQFSVQFIPNIGPENLQNFEGLYNLWRFRSICGTDIQCECPTGFLFKTVTIQTVRNDTFFANILCENQQRIGFPSTARPLIASPDCLETTGNVTYCESQPQSLFSTIPRDLHVRYTDDLAFVNVTWKRPFSVNGEIIEYGINVDQLDHDKGLIRLMTIDQRIPPDVLFYEISSSEIKLGSNYIISIFAFVRLSSEYASSDERPGIPATFIFQATPPIETTTTKAEGTGTMNVKMELPHDVTNKSNLPLTEIIIVGIPAVLVALVSIGVLVLVCRYRDRRKPEPVPEHTEYVIAKAPALPEFRDHEILHLSDLIFEETIGRGQFGEVYKAKWNKTDQSGITVAVKTTKENLSPSLKEEFLDEVRVMIDIGKHSNILDILACRTVVEPYYIITEYMKYGSLKEYLTKSQDREIVFKDPNYELTDFKQLQISHQISKGMEYLASKNFIHGDLAARNILVGEEFTVKVSDFGLSNDVYQTGYVRLPEESKRPVKWYSIEANLEGKCTTEGDVWSFGIVMYEIYSRGEEPYLGMLPREIITRLEAGYRLDQPEDCPDDIYYLMVDCWLHEPSARPSFAKIRKILEGLLASAQGDSYFDPTQEEESLE